MVHVRLNGPEQPHLGPPHAFPQPRGSILAQLGPLLPSQGVVLWMVLCSALCLVPLVEVPQAMLAAMSWALGPPREPLTSLVWLRYVGAVCLRLVGRNSEHSVFLPLLKCGRRGEKLLLRKLHAIAKQAQVQNKLRLQG